MASDPKPVKLRTFAVYDEPHGVATDGPRRVMRGTVHHVGPVELPRFSAWLMREVSRG